MQIGNTRVRVERSWRSRSVDTARLSFNARLGRSGRVFTQVRRCLIAHDGMASMKDLRAWAYVGQPFQRWQCWSIKRALWKLGAKQIGRAHTVGRPGIWSMRLQKR